MQKSNFNISKMDCPSEENLIRSKLTEFSQIKRLDFDLANRSLTVYHDGPVDSIEKSLTDLNLGARFISSEEADILPSEENSQQKKLLWIVLIINFTFFILEITTGLISKSMGLVADSLDMLADAFVYGISLLAVGGSVIKKKRVARIAGIFQMILAILGFIEVLRRFFGMEQLPDFSTMIIVSVLALAANSVCLLLLQQSRSKKEAHIKASMIFTSNDVIINLGVIVAGLLVHWLNSNKPDLIVGTIVFILVIRGAIRIFSLSK